MLNLVIVIIAIALITIIAIAAVYYGGDAYGDGHASAEAVRYRTEAAQIAGAVTLYRAKGNTIGEDFTLKILTDGNYLSQLPSGWEPGVDVIMKTLEADDPGSEEICFLANKQSNFTFSSSESQVQEYTIDTNMGIPHCDKAGLNSLVPCCVTP